MGVSWPDPLSASHSAQWGPGVRGVFQGTVLALHQCQTPLQLLSPLSWQLLGCFFILITVLCPLQPLHLFFLLSAGNCVQEQEKMCFLLFLFCRRNVGLTGFFQIFLEGWKVLKRITLGTPLQNKLFYDSVYTIQWLQK